ncbi:hydroxymethylbilane synthase [Balneicella halophila]|uniref:Porphobilinogen deaminase n=1 Tax=Balneicella halophila TaxID=1537566 RepID=A0A7L4UTH0_BALHA|nr:hydroxymethylbilane synthase [Balneicella halophila]PVX52454.1 hydroxymethylbilane synthase [Balneicella halophila]
MRNKIRVATRPSLLAYTQTMQTVALLEKAHPKVEFEVIKYSTQGDRDQRSSLTQFGGTGVFVKELEHALLSNQADIAIHSLKDMPSNQPDGLCLAGFPKREDPRDVFVVTNEPVKKVGTGSPRRLLQCALLHPDVSFVEIRGNVGTRLEKMENGLCDATFLAKAGLNRLGIELPQGTPLDVENFIPAIGQGALAIECRTDDVETHKIVEAITDENTKVAVGAERAFMKEVEGGCKFPLAAHAFKQGGKLRFLAVIGDLNTNEYIKRIEEFDIDKAVEQAITVAKEMKQACKEKNINLEFE